MRSEAPKLTVGIGVRVFLSSILGMLITSFLIWPVRYSLNLFDLINDASLFDTVFSEFLVSSLMFFMFLIFFGIPLIIIAVIVASLLEKTIERNILIWSTLAPVFVWLIVNAFVIAIKFIYREDRANMGGTLGLLVFNPHYLFFFGSIPSAILFYLSTKKFSESFVNKQNVGN